MNKFVESVETTPTYTLTFNGGDTLLSSMDNCVDLFFLVGSARDENIERVNSVFDRAYAENRELALRILLWVRDIRGGAGERQTFRNLLQHLEDQYFEEFRLVLPYVPIYGRWDDVLVAQSERGKDLIARFVKQALDKGDGLAAKWMPRKGDTAVMLRNRLGMTPKQYRKTLVNLTDVVENKMCAKKFDQINFSQVPSIAAARYKNAFCRHVPELYQEYVKGLSSGKTKINANSIFPHDVLKELNKGRSIDKTKEKAIIEQWNSLPNYIGNDLIIPMVDVSGSMTCSNNSTKPIDVSVSLGAYISEKNTGPFNGLFLTFSGRPIMEKLTGNIVQRFRKLRNASWGTNTNLEVAFKEVLRFAKANNVPQEDMPKYLIVLSDMEFDQATRGLTSFEDAREQFEEAGYDLPNVIFWNLDGREGNVPVTKHQTGAALVSGFSPSIMKSVLKTERLTPQAIMEDTVLDSRYNIFNQNPEK